MVVYLFCLLFVSHLFTETSASPLNSWKLKRSLQQQDEPSAIPYSWITQPLDHFDASNTKTWSQKFLVNSQYWDGKGPIFILLGGEGPVANSSVTGHFVLNNYAKTFNAMIVAVEHRFYGDSMPTADLSTPNLVYLTSQQALADYAKLAQQLKTENPGCKVVSFGGSYSGALSAWFRYKYPGAVDIAIASSGPVHAQTDFPQYLQVVSDSLATTGSQCNIAIEKGTRYYANLLASAEGRKKIDKDFNTCAPIQTELDAVTFLEFLADTVAGFVQYNNDNNSYYPYDMVQMCSILTSAPIDQAFPAFVASWNNFTQATCSDVTYASAMSQLTNVDPKSPDAAGRTWTWQTCNEFGFYQTGEFHTQPFSSQISLDYFIKMCQEAFGKSLDDVNEGVYKTNAFYGGRSVRGKTSKTFFLNGSIDPWHALGVITPSNDPSVPVAFINGTAHCADLYPPRTSDVQELTEARTRVAAFLKHWL
eukprot:TRINITY_DN11708_c0_g1_i1.p1 TRINITY_DN11708_c0_g1~~TRINITY_DN11708_c0_g1_i1.p1  ORF type:complete len:477 (-),score=110.62 TRINITY_DN11708_c0_g1_i1:102-1532(-)